MYLLYVLIVVLVGLLVIVSWPACNCRHLFNTGWLSYIGAICS